MKSQTKIEWADFTFNPWRGCTKVSEGCKHCYAEKLSHRKPKVLGEWGPGKPRILASEAMWREPVKWNREVGWFSHTCDGCGKKFPSTSWSCCGVGFTPRPRPRVFCASLADWLDEEVPIEWLARLLALIHATPNLDWLLLTKRPQNWAERLKAVLLLMSNNGAPDAEDARWNWLVAWQNGHAPANVWIGTSAEHQAAAEERIPLLLSIPAKVRFLSCEPLLGPVELRPWLGGHRTVDAGPRGLPGSDSALPSRSAGIDWVIAGGESGPGARAMHPDWPRSLRDQCAAAGVDFFFKQWGEWLAAASIDGTFTTFDFAADARSIGDREWHQWPDGWKSMRVGKKAAGRLLDGVEHGAFPLDSTTKAPRHQGEEA